MSMSKADILADCLQSEGGTEEQRSRWISELWELYEQMERERDEARKALREFLALADDFSNTRRGYLRFLDLADKIEKEADLSED